MSGPIEGRHDDPPGYAERSKAGRVVRGALGAAARDLARRRGTKINERNLASLSSLLDDETAALLLRLLK